MNCLQADSHREDPYMRLRPPPTGFLGWYCPTHLPEYHRTHNELPGIPESEQRICRAPPLGTPEKWMETDAVARPAIDGSYRETPGDYASPFLGELLERRYPEEQGQHDHHSLHKCNAVVINESTTLTAQLTDKKSRCPIERRQVDEIDRILNLSQQRQREVSLPAIPVAPEDLLLRNTRPHLLQQELGACRKCQGSAQTDLDIEHHELRPQSGAIPNRVKCEKRNIFVYFAARASGLTIATRWSPRNAKYVDGNVTFLAELKTPINSLIELYPILTRRSMARGPRRIHCSTNLHRTNLPRK